MNTILLNSIQKSIDHWEKILKQTQQNQFNPDSHHSQTCSLCEYFIISYNEGTSKCIMCPLYLVGEIVKDEKYCCYGFNSYWKQYNIAHKSISDKRQKEMREKATLMLYALKDTLEAYKQGVIMEIKGET